MVYLKRDIYWLSLKNILRKFTEIGGCSIYIYDIFHIMPHFGLLHIQTRVNSDIMIQMINWAPTGVCDDFVPKLYIYMNEYICVLSTLCGKVHNRSASHVYMYIYIYKIWEILWFSYEQRLGDKSINGTLSRNRHFVAYIICGYVTW